MSTLAKFKQWLVAIKLNSTLYFTVWGYDSTVDESTNDTKILINHHKSVALFSETKYAVNAVIQHKIALFDSYNLLKWATAIREEKLFFEVNTLLDFDNIIRIIDNTKLSDIKGISPADAKEVIEFINFCSDFADQSNDEKLMSLCQNPNVRLFWNYIYDTFFWKKEEKASLKPTSEKYDNSDFQKVLKQMYTSIITNIAIMDVP
ncbi:hypothetical protein [Spirosoma montaniterrae]|uniref:Uncharacterized protein n=1 Tax=Spirosoma montaniterrae TaxID=1178516 RepID=A0A1P9X3B4_9BACT|nr:hypothetical protein [Spirosoma montaniterrae]AQG82120.1 hypothetical protein AWR27_24180 [Spirosoma montaniterrae]